MSKSSAMPLLLIGGVAALVLLSKKKDGELQSGIDWSRVGGAVNDQSSSQQLPPRMQK